MAYDAARGGVVLYGGTGAGGVGRLGMLADTWTWDGTRWRREGAADGGPGPRCVHAMAYDERRGRVVLHGGSGPDGQLGDTWEWDGGRWTRVAG